MATGWLARRAPVLGPAALLGPRRLHQVVPLPRSLALLLPLLLVLLLLMELLVVCTCRPAGAT